MTVQRPIPVRADPAALHASTVRSLARAIIAFAITERERGSDPEKVLRSRFGDDQLAPLILRAATSPLTIANASGFAQVDLVDDILVLVGKVSAASQVLQAGLQLRFDGAASIAVPPLARIIHGGVDFLEVSGTKPAGSRMILLSKQDR